MRATRIILLIRLAGAGGSAAPHWPAAETSGRLWLPAVPGPAAEV